MFGHFTTLYMNGLTLKDEHVRVLGLFIWTHLHEPLRVQSPFGTLKDH